MAHSPVKGLWDGLDPALPDEIYSPFMSPDMENIRPGQGLIQTRYGFAAASDMTAAGSGAPRLLFSHYTAAGARYRLYARGNTTAGALYDLLVGTDTTFQAISGATSLGNSAGDLFRAVSIGGRVYLTDRQNVLRMYNPSSRAISTVGQPTRPSTAPTVKPRTFALLEEFTGAAPYGWTESDAQFSLEANSGTDSLPAPGSFYETTVTVRQIKITGGAVDLDDTITENYDREPVPSKTIAFWYVSTTRNQHIVFEIGLGGEGEFPFPIKASKANDDQIIFAPIGSIGTINYKRFRCTKTAAATQYVRLGKMMLPGNLQGLYRWCYTHYDPTSGEESKPNTGYNTTKFSDFSKIGVTNSPASAIGEGGALMKSASMRFTSDSGSDSATTKIRIYRNGGIADLTRDARGQAVWTRVAEILDLSTTLNSSPSAGDLKLTLTAVSAGGTNIAGGDWLVIEPGTIDKEEFVQLAADQAYTDVVIDGVDNTKVTSATRPFEAGDVGKMLTIASGTGFTPGNYTVNSVAAAVATLSAAVGTVGSTGGTGTLYALDTVTKVAVFTRGLSYAHTSGVTAAVAYVDNAADEALDTTQRLDPERDDPPAGVRSLCRSPQGRLVLMGWTAERLGVAFSNRPTVDKPYDFEVFPDDVDPVTRGSLTQGFRISLDGDSHGDEIMWGDYFQGILTILTRRSLYQVHAGSQNEWGEGVVSKVMETGCLCQDTPKIVNNVLYWVAPGPRVMRWDGRGGPEDISFQRISTLLAACPSGYFGKWWAEERSTIDGTYYHLWLVPSGGTTCTKRLDYNLILDAWEPTVYYDSGGTAIAFACGEVWRGVGDNYEMISALSTGATIYQHETGSTDAGEVIRVRWKTKRFRIGLVSKLESFYMRGTGASDTVAVAVVVGGSQYGNVTNNLTSLSLSGSGDVETRKRIPFNAKGRWADLLLTGSVSNRPAVREYTVTYTPIRGGRIL